MKYYISQFKYLDFFLIIEITHTNFLSVARVAPAGLSHAYGFPGPAHD